jgi:hypothetical protein
VDLDDYYGMAWVASWILSCVQDEMCVFLFSFFLLFEFSGKLHQWMIAGMHVWCERMGDEHIQVPRAPHFIPSEWW